MRKIVIAFSLALVLSSACGRPFGPAKPKYRPVRIPWYARYLSRPECTAKFNRTTGLAGRNGLINTRFRWQRFDVRPDNNFEPWELQNIQNAMAILSDILPCIEFGFWIPGSTPTVRDYVRIIKRGEGGCNAIIGRVGGVQIINFESPRCTSNIGTIMHEMCHALGLHHEHQRPDRDNYINIYWQNIWENQRSNFDMLSSNFVSDFGVAYNTRSIMHYGSYSFSKGGVVMLDKNNQRIWGDEKMQDSDRLKLKRMYGCQ